MCVSKDHTHSKGIRSCLDRNYTWENEGIPVHPDYYGYQTPNSTLVLLVIRPELHWLMDHQHYAKDEILKTWSVLSAVVFHKVVTSLTYQWGQQWQQVTPSVFLFHRELPIQVGKETSQVGPIYDFRTHKCMICSLVHVGILTQYCHHEIIKIMRHKKRRRPNDMTVHHQTHSTAWTLKCRTRWTPVPNINIVKLHTC